MRKLTENDLANIVNTTINGYCVEAVRVKCGNFTDSDHYGIVLGKNVDGDYVTWQWHLYEDETPWGYYHGSDREAAIKDYNNRDLGTQAFKVTITETLKLTVEVEAKDQHDAEQIVSDCWRKGKYVLNADNFVDVEFQGDTVN